MANREITVRELSKRYPQGMLAIDGISLYVPSGGVFGFLGPNGAGKSTTIKILTTLALPTSGSATVGGFDVVTQADQVRRIMGVALQDIGIDALMKPAELLTLQGQLFGAGRAQASRRADELIHLVGLEAAVDRRVGTYSGGMKRRLDLALALVHQPEILFLDEPTTGLDPASRRDLWREVRRLNRDFGITIFLTTQYLEEADELADTVAIISRGRIAVTGSPAALKAGIGRESINIALPDRASAEQAAAVLREMTGQLQVDGETLRLYMDGAAAAVPGVVNRLQQAGIVVQSLTLSQPTLDDVFLQVTGQSLQTPAPAARQPA